MKLAQQRLATFCYHAITVSFVQCVLLGKLVLVARSSQREPDMNGFHVISIPPKGVSDAIYGRTRS